MSTRGSAQCQNGNNSVPNRNEVEYMGRLSKRKIDEIKRLHEQGFLKKEIAEKLKVSRTTVNKYISEEKASVADVSSSVLAVLAENFLTLLLDLNNITNFDNEEGKEILRVATDYGALDFARSLFKQSLELGKRVLDSSTYIHYLKDSTILDLRIPNEKLDNDERKLRKKWIQLLKEFYPEKLVELF